MADLYGSTSQKSPPPPPHESEDINTFLHHILHAPEAGSGTGSDDFHRFDGFGEGNRIGSSLGLNLSDPGFKMISDSGENDLGDFSCDSEGTGGASEVQVNPGPSSSRSSSKRTRAAEVHNQSEKRRRSRINEKMKALQNLIPNSNKTDKASMLDEAIEYLKQLQLQVQMLSMRNGTSLHPLCLPGVLQPVQLSQLGMEFDEGNGLLNSTREARPFPGNQECSMQTAFDISHQNTSNLQHDIPSSSTDITNSETPFGFEQAEYGPFNLPPSPKEMCKEVTLPQHKLELIGSGNNSSSSKQ